MNVSKILDEVWPQLRPYQQDGIRYMMHRPHNLNWDDMGLGKTVCTLFTAIYKAREMFEARDYDGYQHPILICCPTKALFVWREEITKWFHLDSTIYWGTIAQRKKIDKHKAPFLITTYGMMKELSNSTWTGVICDEIHEVGILNQKTQTYAELCKLRGKINFSFLLTGTPIRQGVIDNFAPLHFVDGNVFQNYWQFVNTYCITIATAFGKDIQRNPRDIAAYRSMIGKYRLRRIKTEVLKDLPGKQRQAIPLQMTPIQAKAHHDMLEEYIYADDDSIVVSPNAMTAILRARQILVSPRLLGIDDDGVGLTYIKDEGRTLLESGKPFVVFTPFRQAIAIIADVIQELHLGTKIYTITGGLNPVEFARQWQGFQDPSNKNKVLLCVIKSGASFHATEAADCFFLGYEWDFNYNVQSEDRLCRMGQKNFVHCRYLLHEGTVDEQVKSRLNSKNDASNWIIGTDEQYKMMLRKVRAKID